MVGLTRSSVVLVIAWSACGKVVNPNAADASLDATISVVDAAIDAPVDAPDEPALAVSLTGTPDPGTVFALDQCYLYPNNLVNSIWHFPTDLIISGKFEVAGVWAFAAGTDNFPAAPEGTVDVDRLVHVPLTKTVVHSTNNQFTSAATTHQIGAIAPESGVISNLTPIQLSDDFTGNCDAISASPDEFLCYDGANVRHYTTTEGSAEVSLAATVALSDPPGLAGAGFGGTFAFDGAFYYFPAVSGTTGGANYVVFDTNGDLVDTFTAPGDGNVNGTYFDWAIGRYATHDGFGTRVAATNFTSAGGADDSQCYSAESPAHTR